jgi:hypothetical protein
MADPKTPQTYVVRQGEYLDQIAYKLGFDAETVWTHEKNTELRETRKDHRVLCPGDILYIPATEERQELPLNAGEENNYQAAVPTRKVEFVLRNEDGPLPNEDFILNGLGTPIEDKSDAEGKVSVTVPVTARDVVLVLKNYGAFNLRIGDLDPITEPSGLQARLMGLGFHPGPVTGEIDDDTRYAIQRFQVAKGLEVTGDTTPEILSAIQSAYGL